jgi:putative transposase
VNHKKIQRLWREEGLRVPQRRRRKRHGSSSAPPGVVPDAPNRVWAVDFQFDVTTDGRPIKIVSIIDEHTRECLGGMVERSITGEHLTEELDRLAAQRGAFPTVLRCDNGPISLQRTGRLGLRSSRPALHPIGEPWRNGYVESFNSRVRDECLLNINSFWSLAQARVVISEGKHDYNHHRHSALDYQPPTRYAVAVPTAERSRPGDRGTVQTNPAWSGARVRKPTAIAEGGMIPPR